MPAKKVLTRKEIAALEWFVYVDHEQHPRQLYELAFNGTQDEFNALKTPEVSARNYLNNESVIIKLQEVRRAAEIRREMEQKNMLAEILREEEHATTAEDEKREERRGRPRRDKTGPDDYSDPRNQTKLLNEIIKGSDDNKEKIDALKLIMQGQKDDRDGARNQKQVRFYLPLTCDICPLRLKAPVTRRQAAGDDPEKGTK